MLPDGQNQGLAKQLDEEGMFDDEAAYPLHVCLADGVRDLSIQELMKDTSGPIGGGRVDDVGYDAEAICVDLGNNGIHAGWWRNGGLAHV